MLVSILFSFILSGKKNHSQIGKKKHVTKKKPIAATGGIQREHSYSKE